MITQSIIKNKENLLLVSISLLLVQLLIIKEFIFMPVAGLWLPVAFTLVLAQSNNIGPENFDLKDYFSMGWCVLWSMISFYIPVQITDIIRMKFCVIEKIWIYLLSSFLFHIGLMIPYVLWMIINSTIGGSDYDFMFFIRFPISFFIAWACYKNIDNFKKLFTRDFWDIKTIARASLRFMVLSILSGIVTCAAILGIFYISTQF